MKLNWGSMYYLRNAIILQSHGLSSKHHNFLQYFFYIFENPSKKIKEAKENRQSDGPIELTCTKMFPKRLIKVF